MWSQILERFTRLARGRWVAGGLVGAAVIIVGFLFLSSCNRANDEFAYESQQIGTIRAKADGPLFAMMQSADINALEVTADEISLTGMASEILGLPAASNISYEANRYSPDRDAFGLKLSAPNAAPVWFFPGSPPGELPGGVLRLAHVAPSDEVRMSLHSEPSQSSAAPFVTFSLEASKLASLGLDVPEGSELGIRTSGRASAYLVVESGAPSDMRFEMSTDGELLALSGSPPDSVQVNGVDILPHAELSEVLIVSDAAAEGPSSKVHSVVGLAKTREQIAIVIASDTDVRALEGAPALQQAGLDGSVAPAFGVAGIATDVWISRQVGNLVVRDRSYEVSGPSAVEIRGIETRGIPAMPSGVASPKDLGVAPEEVWPLGSIFAPPGLVPPNANFVLPLDAASRVSVTGRSDRVLLNGSNVASTWLDNFPAWLQPLLVTLAVGFIITALAAEIRRLVAGVGGE